MSLPFYDNMPGPERRDKFNQMWTTYLEAVANATGYSPMLSVVPDGARRVLHLYDWEGTGASKPTITGYLGPAGVVPNIADASDVRGPQGVAGPANSLAIGTVVEGSAAATITGAAPAQTLNLSIPRGLQGLQGIQGPKGDTGSQGIQGPKGDTGPQGVQGLAGLHGWTPKFAVVTDGARRVQQVVDWFGGTGSKPATGEYVGATGLVANIAQAVDIRGPSGAGTGNVNPTGTIAANDLAAFADASGQVIKALKAADLPVSTATQTALDGKAPLNGTGTSGTWPISITGNAATATKLATARAINGVNFDGTANITVADATKLPLTGGAMTGAISFAGAQTWPTFNQSTTGNAATATKLATARTINGTTFDGSANISVSVGWASVTGKPAVIAAGADAAAARTAIGAGTSDLADAPSDGKTYGRKDAAWAEVVSGGATYRIGDVQIAPTAPATGTWLLCDGSAYLQSSYTDLYAAIGLIANSPGQVSSFTSRTMPSSANWAAMGYGNGVFVATTNNGTGAAASSTDGITWTARTVPVALQFQSVAYGNGTFVAVGLSQTATATSSSLSSSDGMTWTSRTMPSSQLWNSVAFGNGTFVAISRTTGTTASTSPDGITWTTRTLPTSAGWWGIAFGNGIFVAVASGGTAAAISPDGISWTAVTLPVSGNWRAIAYGNGNFVTLGLGSAVALTSPDGITWTSRTLPSSSAWSAVAFGGGTFMAVTQTSGNTCAVSSGGIVWTTRTLPSTGAYHGVAYGNKVFVTAALASTSAASAYAGISYNPSTQFAVPRAISEDINSWVRAL